MTEILTITLNPALDASAEADSVRPTHKVRTTEMRFDPGGGGINVTRVVAMMGGRTDAIFPAGAEIGNFLDRLLTEQDIRHRVIPVAGQTRINFVVVEPKTGLEYRFVAPGPTLQPSELQRCLDEVAAHEAGYVVASGSLPVAAPDDTYARLAEITAARGAKFVLDSSGAGLKTALTMSKVHLVKPSLSELEQLEGRKLDEEGIRQSAAGIVARGAAELVAVTLGANGALLASANGILRVPAIQVPVHSAVGAGDSFLGAMVWALAEGKPAEEAFQWGMAAGAAAVMTRGARLCQRSDVFELFAKCHTS